ncbi:MAG: hypothetical protein AAGF75_01830 [Cyanobacteria bacterium P01_H01_bin.130]
MHRSMTAAALITMMGNGGSEYATGSWSWQIFSPVKVFWILGQGRETWRSQRPML